MQCWRWLRPVFVGYTSIIIPILCVYVAMPALPLVIEMGFLISIILIIEYNLPKILLGWFLGCKAGACLAFAVAQPGGIKMMLITC